MYANNKCDCDGDPKIIKLRNIEIKALEVMENALESANITNIDMANRVLNYVREELTRIYHGHYFG